jgi:hypothetical protein
MGQAEVSRTVKSVIALTCAGALAAAALFSVVAFTPRSAEATPALAQKTAKACGACHKNPGGGGELTAAGKAYKGK